MITDKKYKILLVDDDKFLLGMYVKKFDKSGLEVKSAISGAEAIKILAEDGFIPDIIILDLIMPGMDGIETLTKMKKDGLVKDAIVVILTNQGQSSDIKRAEELNVDGYIVKATSIPSEVVEEVLKIYKSKKK